ncbi:MAG: phage holin family protein [Blastocatellia bacterium]|nr:phage holin family protein [Blastocatellia bacterium]
MAMSLEFILVRPFRESPFFGGNRHAAIRSKDSPSTPLRHEDCVNPWRGPPQIGGGNERDEQEGGQMRDTRLLLRWVCTSIAIYVAVKLLPGMQFEGPWWHLGIVALIFGLFNALVRPILMLLTCPLIVLTLGLFIPIINAIMLGLTAATAETFGIHFQVAGFWSALWGAIVISIVSAVFNLLIGNDDEERRAAASR